ncbi:potassium transporter [Deferribacterales bacterium Es71-Z0220]|uniref:TrkH family potassium uptake protein n=1 Tax=Deferrivibrio essentukiensis TaxID=2880922 RepID=UPI001F60001C|nr:potassium transporter TrkG [Deferrivibrio essentukiensis]MCB4204452.1 potassium transporter [Deferrivibrio essentukiensis]
MKKFFRNPLNLFVITFGLLIIIGSLLLSIPGINYRSNFTYIDALFTATSAVCVTGLTTFPVSSFSFWGQIIILLLIELGGIGIMTLTTFIVLFLRGELDLKGRISVAKISGTLSIAETDNIIVFIIGYMITIEVIGSILLFFGFYMENINLSDSFYYSIFYSISAFCNAGFSIFDESLVNQSAYIKVVIAILIILGGIGFYVVFDVMRFFRLKNRLKSHTKIVIITTFFLIISGMLILYAVEAGKVTIVDAFFQSITARTAGFNSVDIAGLHNVSIFVIFILMVVGASPGSTGGGIKTTTFFVIVLSVLNTLKGSDRLVVFKREIPYQNILRAHAIFFLYILFISVGTTILLLYDDFGFINTFFEVASAVGTVGLSLGITSKLDGIGKSLLIFLMFAGRVGPSILFMLLLNKDKKTHLKYPEEKIILG